MLDISRYPPTFPFEFFGLKVAGRCKEWFNSLFVVVVEYSIAIFFVVVVVVQKVGE